MANEEWSKATIFGKRVRYIERGFEARIGPFKVYDSGGWPGALCSYDVLLEDVVVASGGPFQGNWRDAIGDVEQFIVSVHKQLDAVIKRKPQPGCRRAGAVGD